MNKIVGGRFNGTGTALYVCIGFVPDWVRIWVPDAADNAARAFYSKYFTVHDSVEGFVLDSNGASYAEYTYGEGIQPYYGGDTLTATMAGTVTYGEGVYLKEDKKDYRMGADDAVSEDIDTWTLDTAATPTGHFNEDVTGTYIGIGSRICIDGKWYTITALTATEGEGDDEVELNYPAPSGDITYIGGKFSMKPMIAKEITPAGFKVNATAVININDEVQVFEAGRYDD